MERSVFSILTVFSRSCTVVVASLSCLSACSDDKPGSQMLDEGSTTAASDESSSSVGDESTETTAAAQREPGSGGIEVPRLDCENRLSDLPWEEPVPVEAIDGIEVELDEMNFAAMPESFDTSGMLPFFTGYLAYALELPVDEVTPVLTRDVALSRGKLGEVVYGAIWLGRQEGDGGLGLDVQFFRRGFFRYYACSREFPLTLEGFRTAYWDYPGEGDLVEESAAKCGPRNLIIDHSLGIYVAQTIVDDHVRETEILMKSEREDGQLDFLVYDTAGKLSDRSVFPTLSMDEITSAAPYVCMSCHIETGDGNPSRFELLLPTETGACQK
jgi:hypothetical protein